MWVGTMPDLADPNHSDPVLRESTRVQAIGHNTSQVNGHSLNWPDLLDLSQNFWEDRAAESDGIETELQITHDDMRQTEFGQKLTALVDFYHAITPDDPPIFTGNGYIVKDEADITTPYLLNHHPMHSTPIYERCIEAGLVCEIDTRIMKIGPHARAWINHLKSVRLFIMEQLEK